ncbi:hypothetical protein ACTOJ1_001218 [Shigella flexneri]
MKNEKIKDLLIEKQKIEDKFAALHKEQEILIAASKINREAIGNAFIEAFTNSDEDILFMMESLYDSDVLYKYREKYFKDLGLNISGYFPSSSQYGLEIDLSRSDEELDMSVTSLENIFHLIKPIYERFREKEVNEYHLIKLSYDLLDVDTDVMFSNVYLLENNGQYKVMTLERYHNEIFAEWSHDLKQVILNTKEAIISKYAYKDEE